MTSADNHHYVKWCETHNGAAKRVGGTDEDPQIWCWEAELRYAASALTECRFTNRELLPAEREGTE